MCTCAAPLCCSSGFPAAGTFLGYSAPASLAVGCFLASEFHTPSCSAPVWLSSWPQSPVISRSLYACLEGIIKNVNVQSFTFDR